MEMEEYFSYLENEVNVLKSIAERARSQGLDPSLEPEIPFAKDLAERVEGLVGPRGVASRIRELNLDNTMEEISIMVAKEIVQGEFGEFPTWVDTADQALRTALAILTEGIVAAPFEGIVKVGIKKNSDGSEYLAIYFAGPIRSAGGSAQALAVLVGDVIRQSMGLARYKPTEDEIERFVEEVDLYHAEAARLQYHPSPEEVRKAVRNIPIEITGESTDKVEVSGYRDLERIETNQLRGGGVLVLAEGVLQKAAKVMKYVRKLEFDGWDFLKDFIHTKVSSKESDDEIKPSFKFIKDLIAGRPVFSYPSRKGGFRLRYGRSRNSGFAAMSIHPATMVLLDDFVATGTQMKTERPGKGTAVTPNDSIEGPIVRLGDGSVMRVNDLDTALKIRPKVKKILFLGDILINFGDFLENNHLLMPSGYVEEWWVQELEEAVQAEGDTRFSSFFDWKNPPDFDLAVEISREFNIPLHPRYINYYHDATREELAELVAWIVRGRIEDNSIILPMPGAKEVLEEIGAEHRAKGEEIIIEDFRPLLLALGIGRDLNTEAFKEAYEKSADSMELVNSFGITIMKKAPTYIGARMGRPEKAKERRMSPPVNTLFPIGQYGGKTRDIKKAAQKGNIQVEVARLKCSKCGEISHRTRCPKCNELTEKTMICISCGKEVEDERRHEKTCGGNLTSFEKRHINLGEILTSALNKVGNTHNDLKGVVGMTSLLKIPEPLEKGILRSKNGVFVFKDGTVRFDSTDVPVTHLRPREIGVKVEDLHRLGYTTDYLGEKLTGEDQIIELLCQDVLVPESGVDYIIGITKYMDDLLKKLYGLEPFYNVKEKKDLLGHLVLGMAPHTSAAILGRIIGFTSAHVGYAHPLFHAAKRRNCDGDEDGLFLLLDALINFSRSFLPSSRGGKMDAPLVLTIRLDPAEVDHEAHNIDIVDRYPLEFYKGTLRLAKPQEFEKTIPTIGTYLGMPGAYKGMKFTHDTQDISAGTKISVYKTIGEMVEKLNCQLKVGEKIRAVDEGDVARRIIESHFLPDMMGNLRAFSTQTIRCVNCNTKYRRVPLTGKCRKCGNGKLLLTVSRGSVEKYLNITEELIVRYKMNPYVEQRVKILRSNISSIFDNDKVKQHSISDFF